MDKPSKNKLSRVTAWIPQSKLTQLMQRKGKSLSQSELLRLLVEQDLERENSSKAHKKLYGIASSKDFDDRLL